MSPEIIVDKREMLSALFAERFRQEAQRSIDHRGFFSLALPGGSVADWLFPSLAESPLDWSRTHFFWGDERAVPPDHPESNYGTACRFWLEPAGVPGPSRHPMPAQAEDLPAAAQQYANEMTRVLGTPARLDLVLLGMGPDGHVCSLFAGHRLLNENERWVAAILDSPKPPPRRLTLTLPALRAADLVVVAASGAAKAPVLRDAIENDASTLPVALAVRGAGRALYLLDAEAASQLSRT